MHESTNTHKLGRRPRRTVRVITATAFGYCGWHSRRERGGAEAICELWHWQPLTAEKNKPNIQHLQDAGRNGGRKRGRRWGLAEGGWVGVGGRTCIQTYHPSGVWGVEAQREVYVCLRVEDGRCNERGGVRETKGGLGKHKLKALNVTAHSIALRHRSLLPILFAAFYNINNLENIAADCSEVAQRKKYVALCFYFFCSWAEDWEESNHSTYFMKEEITPEDALEHYRTKRTSHCGVSSPVQPMLPGWGCLVGCVLTGEAGGAKKYRGRERQMLSPLGQTQMDTPRKNWLDDLQQKDSKNSLEVKHIQTAGWKYPSVVYKVREIFSPHGQYCITLTLIKTYEVVKKI